MTTNNKSKNATAVRNNLLKSGTVQSSSAITGVPRNLDLAASKAAAIAARRLDLGKVAVKVTKAVLLKANA